MVDWDRVEQLRSKGWDWDEIADDPKVGFTPDTATGNPGRALRVLYHRRRGKGATTSPTTTKKSKSLKETGESRWSLLRVLYVLLPVVAIWFVGAYIAPSPVGIILPAIPYIGLILAGVLFVFLYFVFRADRRWTTVFRNTLIGGIVLGLVFTGVVTLAGSVLFGCPYLPPSSSLTAQGGPGWSHGAITAWQDSGKVVVFFYGATWCPYCSAGSWTIYKALSEYGTLTPDPPSLQYSSLSDVYAGTPEVVLGNLGLTSSNVSFQVSEDQSGVEGTFPGTSNCYQAAYVSAYSGSAIPFLVVNGQWVHAGSPIINPATLAAYNYANATAGANNGATDVYHQVLNESGTAWSAVNTQAYWIMAYIAVSLGASGAGGGLATLDYLASTYHWTAGTKTAVLSDVNQIT